MSKQKIFKIGMLLFCLMATAPSLAAQDYSLYLNGNGQYVNCGNPDQFNSLGALTVEAWILPSDFKAQSHMNTIVAKTIWSNDYSHGWTLRYGSENGSLNFNVGCGVGNSWFDCIADNALTLGVWQHVAATYDGSNIKLYVNGTEIASQAFVGGITNADIDLCIGTILNALDPRFMTGQVDEVRIWNVARTASEISSNMNQSVSGANLVAYYKMSNGSGSTLTDDSGNGHNAELSGSPTWAVDLLPDYSLQLNGDGQYVNCGSSTDFNFSTALSVEAWIYPTDFKDQEHLNTIVAKTDWSNEHSYGWTLRYGSDNETLNFNIGGGGGISWIDCRAEGVLTLNTWQHVAGTYDGSNIKLYVNGAEVATTPFAGSISNSSRELCIGTILNSDDPRYMTGQVDEVRIWNVTRSAEEILANMKQNVSNTNLVAYYKMREGSGSTLTDSSNHGHSGTLVGNPQWRSNTIDIYESPLVSSIAVSSITHNSATANGDVGSLGYPQPIQHGHCWKTDGGADPTIEDSKTMLGPVCATGPFSSSITGLIPETHYWVRAYVTIIVNGIAITSYDEPVEFSTVAGPPPLPDDFNISSATSSTVKATWRSAPYNHDYNILIDASTSSDFSSYVNDYHDYVCGSHSGSSFDDSSFTVTELVPSTIYRFRIRSYCPDTEQYSTYTISRAGVTKRIQNVSYDTGNISGVHIFCSSIDFGIDPPSPLVLYRGFSGTIQAEKDGYTWSLAAGSANNEISYLNSDISISFVGTYSYEDPAHPGFSYEAEPGIPISVSTIAMEDLTAPPPHSPGDAFVYNFIGSDPSDITITVPLGTWYIVAYYDDPSDGGLAWHHASPYPALGPQEVVFQDLPFGAKSDIPIVIGSEDATLPVELSAFTAVATGGRYVNLNWVTQSETGVSGFYIYRDTSENLASAALVSHMIPATNSSEEHCYTYTDKELFSHGTYYYWLQIADLDGSESFYGPASLVYYGGEEPPLPGIPSVTELRGIFPNPFNPNTNLSYSLAEETNVSVRIFNSRGQLVRTLNEGHVAIGHHSASWDGKDDNGRTQSTGVYFFRMQAGNKVFNRKAVLMK